MIYFIWWYLIGTLTFCINKLVITKEINMQDILISILAGLGGLLTLIAFIIATIADNRKEISEFLENIKIIKLKNDKS